MDITHGRFKVIATASVDAITLLVLTGTVGPKRSTDFELQSPGSNKMAG